MSPRKYTYWRLSFKADLLEIVLPDHEIIDPAIGSLRVPRFVIDDKQRGAVNGDHPLFEVDSITELGESLQQRHSSPNRRTTCLCANLKNIRIDSYIKPKGPAICRTASRLCPCGVKPYSAAYVKFSGRSCVSDTQITSTC